ncbi:hypothetical protein EC973_007470 [Apophysomyces ossiformis]|uniref:Uncharacterized protein n=1 Tax=Apophysomyces ossiformis TaxID=679940 RepID=A0A8H7BXT6_9FUNG|nr:hypothetical protein EC973_007470 [Apophysomyces ossiformis]
MSQDSDDEYGPVVAAWGSQAGAATTGVDAWKTLVDPNVKIKANGLGSGNLHRRGPNYKPIEEQAILDQRLGVNKPKPKSDRKKASKRKPQQASTPPTIPSTPNYATRNEKSTSKFSVRKEVKASETVKAPAPQSLSTLRPPPAGGGYVWKDQPLMERPFWEVPSLNNGKSTTEEKSNSRYRRSQQNGSYQEKPTSNGNNRRQSFPRPSTDDFTEPSQRAKQPAKQSWTVSQSNYSKSQTDDPKWPSNNKSQLSQGWSDDFNSQAYSVSSAPVSADSSRWNNQGRTKSNSNRAQQNGSSRVNGTTTGNQGNSGGIPPSWTKHYSQLSSLSSNSKSVGGTAIPWNDGSSDSMDESDTTQWGPSKEWSETRSTPAPWDSLSESSTLIEEHRHQPSSPTPGRFSVQHRTKYSSYGNSSSPMPINYRPHDTPRKMSVAPPPPSENPVLMTINIKLNADETIPVSIRLLDSAETLADRFSNEHNITSPNVRKALYNLFKEQKALIMKKRNVYSRH